MDHGCDVWCSMICTCHIYAYVYTSCICVANYTIKHLGFHAAYMLMVSNAVVCYVMACVNERAYASACVWICYVWLCRIRKCPPARPIARCKRAPTRLGASELGCSLAWPGAAWRGACWPATRRALRRSKWRGRCGPRLRRTNASKYKATNNTWFNKIAILIKQDARTHSAGQRGVACQPAARRAARGTHGCPAPGLSTAAASRAPLPRLSSLPLLLCYCAIVLLLLLLE